MFHQNHTNRLELWLSRVKHLSRTFSALQFCHIKIAVLQDLKQLLAFLTTGHQDAHFRDVSTSGHWGARNADSSFLKWVFTRKFLLRTISLSLFSCTYLPNTKCEAPVLTMLRHLWKTLEAETTQHSAQCSYAFFSSWNQTQRSLRTLTDALSCTLHPFHDFSPKVPATLTSTPAAPLRKTAVSLGSLGTTPSTESMCSLCTVSRLLTSGCSHHPASKALPTSTAERLFLWLRNVI